MITGSYYVLWGHMKCGEPVSRDVLFSLLKGPGPGIEKGLTEQGVLVYYSKVGGAATPVSSRGKRSAGMTSIVAATGSSGHSERGNQVAPPG